ncbi:BON domain-containing protein [Paraburkholderia sp. MMS20-SJTN17]|uniref:BON domain-containing protein n=1 Tax=Paraburkholderia translucens TaxID=2886945 RepID=A0ABS8K7D8_9BURK|nr:BON domain-containing protein [Paraburkholderia sp. MMS20-SJTN17]MCC8400657.1 BON domain-containing protein [Paraburkholderia sp. MMS20-SJTN17]
MKAIHAVRLVSAALLITGSIHAYAQASEAAPATAPTTTSEARAHYRSMKAANRALQRQVRSALVKDRSISTSNITVRARDGAVTLQGSVPVQAQSDRATEVAKGVPGVTSVKNALSIRPVGT